MGGRVIPDVLKGLSAIVLKGKAFKAEYLLGLLTLLGETAKTEFIFAFYYSYPTVWTLKARLLSCLDMVGSNYPKMQHPIQESLCS